jgi:hypothetical protein
MISSAAFRFEVPEMSLSQPVQELQIGGTNSRLLMPQAPAARKPKNGSFQQLSVTSEPYSHQHVI